MLGRHALSIKETDDGQDDVRFDTGIDIDSVYMKAAQRLLMQFQPHMMCTYKSMMQRGKYPLNSCGMIPSLALHDREMFSNFIAATRIGQDATTVTKLEHLVTSVPHSEHTTFCVGISDSFLNPCPEPNMVQMSSEFDPFAISNDNKLVTFQLMCKTKAPKLVTLSCSDIYKAFENKCNENKKFISVVRKVLNTTVNAKIELKTTRYAGHKIFLNPEDADSFVTLYVVRHVKKRQHALTNQLAICAVDIRTHIFDDTDLQDDQDECIICLEQLGTFNLWTCSICHNSMHQECTSRWLQTSSTCPFCRKQIG